MSWRLPVTILKLFKDKSNKLEVLTRRALLNMKTRSLCCHNNFKDSMALLRERTTKSEHWEVKFKALKRISGSQLLKHPSLVKNSINTSHNLKSTTNNLKLTDKRSKSCWVKTINSATKFETPNKTWDFLPHKSANLTTNSRSHATRTKPFKSDSKKSALMLEEELLISKTRLDYWPNNLKDLTVSSKRKTTKLEPSVVKFSKLRRT